MIKEFLSLVLSFIVLLLLVYTNSLSNIYAQANDKPSHSNTSIITFQNSLNSTMRQEINFPKIVTDIKNPQTGETEALAIKDPQTGEMEFKEYSEIELKSSNFDSNNDTRHDKLLDTLNFNRDDTGIELGDLDDIELGENINRNNLIENLLELDESTDTVNQQDEIARENLRDILSGSITNKLLANEIAGNIGALEEESLLEGLSITSNLQEREFNLFKSCIIDPTNNSFSRYAIYEVFGKANMWNPEIRNYTISKDISIELNSRGDKVTGQIRSGEFNPMIETDQIITNCYSEKDFRSNSVQLPKTIPLKSHSLNPPLNSCPEDFNIEYDIYGTRNNLQDTIKIDNPIDIYFNLRMNSDFVNGKLESNIQVGPLYESFKINNISTKCTTQN